MFNNPTPTKIINTYDIPDMKEGEYIPGVGWTPGDSFNGVIETENPGESYSILYFVKQDAIVKIDFNKPDTILKSITFPSNLWLTGSAEVEMIYHPIDSLIWFAGYGDIIANYNIYNDVIKTFNYNDLQLENGYRINSYFTMPNAESTGANVVFFITDKDGTFKLLIFNSNTKNWEIEDIGVPTNSVVYDATKQPRASGVFVWPSNSREVAVSFIHTPSNTMNRRNFAIYNTQTKAWKDFIIPIDLFEGYNATNMEYFLVPRQVSWLKSTKTVGLLYTYFLIEYDPSVGIKETEEGIFQEIGIRRIYPNPAPQRTATAEIMCYVQDLSKLDIGLYNLLGDKILDLNNDYEYNNATKTIYTTFKVPNDIPSGIYYLNVRNGTEYRTQGLVIGQ